MNRKKIIAALLFSGFAVAGIAQETETKKDKETKTKSEKKVTKKVIVVDDSKDEQEIVIDEKDDKKKRKEKKVKVFVNGEDVSRSGDNKEKKVTVIVDGDKVTINGKPVEDMNEEEIEVMRGNGDHLKFIAPYFKKKMRGQHFDAPTPPMNLEDLDFSMEDLSKELPSLNKALLGVVTEKDEKGAKISNVSKESAAEKAGLQKDDIITKVGDDKIENSDDLIKAIGKYNPDDKVKVSYIRDGKNKSTEAILQKNNAKQTRVFSWNNKNNMPMDITPFADGQNFDFKMFRNHGKPKLGLKIQDIEEGNGVKVLEVDAETPAAKAGLQKDDIILEVNGEAIKNVDALKEKLAGANEGDVFKVKFNRNGTEQTVDLKFPKKLKTADL